MYSENELRRIAGSFLIIGFHSTKADEALKNLLTRYNPFGIILFYRNIVSPGQIRKLINEAQSFSLKRNHHRLIICVDQEGGYVARFRDNDILYPSPMALSASRSSRFIYHAGFYSNLYLRALGVNMNLAPVLDVYGIPHNPTLGPRSFSDDIKRVIECSTQWIKGAMDTGIMVVGKHFPGKGQAGKDSHVSLPVITVDKNKLIKKDITPFRKAITKNVPALMTSHAWYRCFEKKIRPGTLSPSINRALLRECLGFSGLLLSDDMEMGAITENYEIGNASIMAIGSGVDALLVCKNPDNISNAYNSIYSAIRRGIISSDIIKESLERKSKIDEQIQEAAKRYKIPHIMKIKEESRKILLRGSRKVITVLKGNNLFPVDREKEIVFLSYSRYPSIIAEDRKDEIRNLILLLKIKCDVNLPRVILYNSLADIEIKAAKLNERSLIFFIARDLYGDEVQRESFDLLCRKFKHIYTVIVKNPLDFQFVMQGSKACIATYCLTYDILSSLIDFIYKGKGGVGTCPVKIKEKR
jgi:beta-N-acetylhexosaminidase